MKLHLALVVLAACVGSKKSVTPRTDTEARSGSDAPGGGNVPDPRLEAGGGGECKEVPGAPSCEVARKGVVEEGALQTVGAIDRTIVRKVVREHFEALRYCYEATLLANPNIAGTVVAKFTIGIDGTVHDVTASGVHPDVETCVATKVRGFRFPKPDGAKVEVAYPFTFKPS